MCAMHGTYCFEPAIFHYPLPFSEATHRLIILHAQNKSQLATRNAQLKSLATKLISPLSIISGLLMPAMHLQSVLILWHLLLFASLH